MFTERSNFPSDEYGNPKRVGYLVHGCTNYPPRLPGCVYNKWLLIKHRSFRSTEGCSLGESRRGRINFSYRSLYRNFPGNFWSTLWVIAVAMMISEADQKLHSGEFYGGTSKLEITERIRCYY